MTSMYDKNVTAVFNYNILHIATVFLVVCKLRISGNVNTTEQMCS